MSSRKVQRDTRIVTSLLVLCLIGFGMIPVLAGEPEGGDSPKAVFKAAQEAGSKRDFVALAKLVAPSERPMMAFGTDMGVGMFVEFYEGEKADALKKKYQKIQDKYKIKIGEEEEEGEKFKMTQDTPQEEIDEHMRKRALKFYGHVDVVHYVPELMGIVLNMPEMAEQEFFPYDKLTNLKINGDKASGTAGDEKIDFLREGGRWYLTADVMD